MATATVSPGRALAVLNSKMRLLAQKQLELERLESELNTRVEALKSVYTTRLSAMRATVGRLMTETEAVCRRERRALMDGAAKSVQTPYGKVGFRRSGVTVCLESDEDVGGVCDALRSRDLGRLVRAREEPDKAAIRSALVAGQVDEAVLKRCGVRIEGGDERFYCVLDRAAGEARP